MSLLVSATYGELTSVTKSSDVIGPAMVTGSRYLVHLNRLMSVMMKSGE